MVGYILTAMHPENFTELQSLSESLLAHRNRRTNTQTGGDNNPSLVILADDSQTNQSVTLKRPRSRTPVCPTIADKSSRHRSTLI